jgi:predicted transcriptional regulator
MKSIDWKEVALDEDKYVMRVFPTSALSSTPEGKLQDVQELLSAGLIDIDAARDLLDFPDLQQYNNIANAAVNDIKRVVELMAEEGEYQTPEPFQDLDYGIRIVQNAYLYYRSAGAPEENLELLRRWIADARSMQKKAVADAALEQQKMQAAATALGEGAAETGDLVGAEQSPEVLSPMQGRSLLNPIDNPLDSPIELDAPTE